jgi:hypothetical protein
MMPALMWMISPPAPPSHCATRLAGFLPVLADRVVVDRVEELAIDGDALPSASGALKRRSSSYFQPGVVSWPTGGSVTDSAATRRMPRTPERQE